MFKTFSDSQLVERAKDGSDMTGFRSFSNCTITRVLNLFETG